MRNRRSLAALLAGLLSTAAAAQTTTKTILVDYRPLNGACGAHFLGEMSAYFTDTAGRNWDYLKIRMQLQKTTISGSTGPTPVVSVAINGVFVGDAVFVPNLGFCWTNLQTYEFGTSFLPGYNAFGQNKLTVYSNGGYAGGPPAELIFTTEQRTFSFDLPPGTNEKMLIHNSRSDHPYPSPDQIPTAATALPRFHFGGKVTARSGSPESDVWVRVVDPADPSPYLPAGFSVPDDNRDPLPKGTLMTSGCTAPSCRAAPGAALQLHSPPSGIVGLELEGTDRYAGDNYQLEASFDPQFTCATAGANGANLCAKSGVLTAWKRVYVESDRMFRRGAYLTNDVAPCSSAPCNLPLSSTEGIHPNRTLRLIHGPRLSVAGPQLPYSETVQVVHVDHRNRVVEVTPYQNAYFGPEADSTGVDRLYLADAVGVISGNDSDDFYTTNQQFIGALFDGTFTEHIFLTNDPVPYLPFEEQLLGDASLPNSEISLLAQRWFFNLNLAGSNHQHLLAGSRHSDPTLQGVTTSYVGTNFCWIFVDTTVNSSPHHGGGEWAFNGEVTAHEMGHQWKVNTRPSGGHCNAFRWDPNGSTLYCTMHGSYGGLSCSGTCPEFYDGVVGFHYQSATDSEFMTIRGQIDPVPQF